ncbi:PIN-like domain-containing protein [Myroides odoratimimus]|uniref:PIN-like domain-containing protein n=1 Tax=Myroides odoratimimus TaxID=76832 RepID=UPI002DB883FE|nr:PIN-like domain-containing protein [Myroides odoratimimus]MEC4043142.1 PIN-like domain-containing protein [Myroides odoratimimus]MEC4151027.1 PIN-like domain-containing protein [Myroides odoratimimus]
MDRNTIKPYRLTEEKETKIWKDAIIIFDSSALLDLYYSPKSEREKIDNEIFKKLKDRLWLPNHVQYEYLKNRESIIKKPITEKYDPLKKKIENLTTNRKLEIPKRVEEIIRETIEYSTESEQPIPV